MGRTSTPKYRVELYVSGALLTPSAWRCQQYGAPTSRNLETWIRRYIDSHKVGGCNEHISRALGYIPVPNRARIVRQSTNTVVVDWVAPAFMVI